MSPLPEAHIACSIKKKDRSEVSHKANELTSSPYISALQATRKRKRDSQNRPGNFWQKQHYGVNCPLNMYMTVGFVRFWRRA